LFFVSGWKRCSKFDELVHRIIVSNPERKYELNFKILRYWDFFQLSSLPCIIKIKWKVAWNCERHLKVIEWLNRKKVTKDEKASIKLYYVKEQREWKRKLLIMWSNQTHLFQVNIPKVTWNCEWRNSDPPNCDVVRSETLKSGFLRQVDQRHQSQGGAGHQAQHEGVEREQSNLAADDRVDVVNAETEIMPNKLKLYFC